MRLPNHSASNGIVDPKMFKPDPEVARKARDELALLETQLEVAEGSRERRRIRKDMRRAKATAKNGVERPHRGAIY
ncbi:MAG: hypothetical protein ABIQ73_10545 [Acidimicrobiales bacterium]